MKIKYIILTFVIISLFIVAAGFASAAVSTYPDKMERGYHFSNNLNDSVASDTLAETGTVAYVNDKNDASSQAVELTTSTDILKTDSFAPVNQSGESFSLWLNMSDGLSGWLMHGNSVSWTDMNWYCDTTGCNVKRDSAASNAGTQSFGTLFDGTWRHLVIVLTTNNITIYNNGAKVGSTTLSEAREKDLNKNLQLAGLGATDDIFDEFIHFNKALSNAEVQELYTGGDSYDQWDSSPASTLDNYTTVSSASYKNEVLVSISTAWATVNTVVVTNNNNNTPYYTTASLTTNATSSNSNAACRIQYDNVTQKTVTRSLTSGTLGNLYLLTGKTNQTVGNFTVTIQCQKTSGGNYQIADSELSILHVYDTTTNTTIDYVTINDTGYSVNTTDTLLSSFSFTTGNVTNTTNIASVVVHGRATYDYSATNNITTYLKIQETGEVCGNYTRYGATGTTGSVGALCVFKDLNSSTAYNFSLYGFTDSGTGGIDDLFMNVYNLETNETAVATTDLSYSVPNNTETTIAAINITNPLGGSYNVFTAASIMVTGNASEDAYFYIDDGTASVKFYRTLDTEGNANIKAQNTFSDSGTGTKTYSLKAYCPSGCEVTEGDFEAFVTDAETASTGTFTITAYNQYNNTQLNTFNATVLGAIYSTTSGSITALGTGTLSVLVEAENFFSNTTSHDTTTSLNASLTKYTEIRANEYLGSAITNFTVNSSVGNYTTTNGVAYLPITSNISVTINGDDIAQTSEYISQVQFYNFTVYAYNSIFIEFRDSTTEALVNNVTLEYFSLSDSGTNSTTTGTLYLTLLQPESYIFTYNATGYDTNNYFLTITNDTYSNITMWLNPSTNTTAITVIILDGSASPLENAIVSAQKHFISDNTYKTVAMGTTNPEGETVMDLVTENEFYKFTVVYNGETVKITNPFIITGTTIKIQVFIGDVALEDFYSWEGITSSLTFNEATDNFRFTFSDGASNNYQYCLYTYRRNPASDTLLDTSCSTGNSGTILYGVDNVSGRTYYSTATVSIGGTEYPLGSYTYTYGATNVGSAGLLPQMLLTIVAGLAGFLLPELLFITVPLSILIGGIMGLHAIPMMFTTPLLVVGIILMIMMRRTSGGL